VRNGEPSKLPKVICCKITPDGQQIDYTFYSCKWWYFVNIQSVGLYLEKSNKSAGHLMCDCIIAFCTTFVFFTLVPDPGLGDTQYSPKVLMDGRTE
jgi:hypothetical protein